MVVKYMPENTEDVIEYEVDGNYLILDDGDTAVNLKKREQDYDVHIDWCFDKFGMLMNGTGEGAQKYVAQVDIPARRYEEVEKENPDFNSSEDECETNKRMLVTRKPVAFSMDTVTLTLWGLEV